MVSARSLILAIFAASPGLCIVRVPRATKNTTLFLDPVNGITYQRFYNSQYDTAFSLAFPPVGNAALADELIGTIVAPAQAGFTGLSLGAMVKSLQIIVWPADGELKTSTRWTSACSPSVYAGPTLTELTDSSIDESHIRFSFHCKNCTEWLDGSIDTSTYSTLAWATSLDTAVVNPADAASVLSYHPVTEFFGADLPSAHLTQEEWDSALERLAPCEE